MNVDVFPLASIKLDEADPRIAIFEERQRLVDQPAFDSMDRCYAVAD